MTYWNETNDSHLQFGFSSKYQEFPAINQHINSEGYVGDLLAPSEAVFLGTCDIMSIANEPELHWARQLHKQLHSNSKFIALGSTGTGVPTMVRRLYAYIQNHGAPKNLYMIIPRFDGYEFVNTDNKCYNVSSRFSTPFFCEKNNMISQYDLNTWVQQLQAVKKTNNKNNVRYLVEERFAFIETLCKLHNINLKWSFNLSDMSIRVLYENLSIFENISDFMKDSFVGLAEVKGHNPYDTSMDVNSHTEIYHKFMNPDQWDFDKTTKQAHTNYERLTYKAPVEATQVETNKLLSTYQEFSFYHYDRNNEEVNKFYVDNMLSLYENGHSTITNPSINDFTGAIICKTNHNIVAGLFYQNYEIERHACLVVVLSHVKLEYRKQGLFKQLHLGLDNIIRDYHYDGVVSYQSIKNTSMNSPRDSVGYVPKYTVYYRPVIKDDK
jgi:hypothetical protein